jgi:hypothetical protein
MHDTYYTRRQHRQCYPGIYCCQVQFRAVPFRSMSPSVNCPRHYITLSADHTYRMHDFSMPAPSGLAAVVLLLNAHGR